MVAATAVEVVLCHLWATGALTYQRNMLDTPLTNLAWVITITHWRIPHFWLIHRAMHPWKTTAVPDVGKFLYRHVHSLHHKSYNPTSFSGTNMHPVESLLYFSAALIAVPFGCHPAIVLGCIVDCAVGAWLGHDGFQWPGSGDFFHQVCCSLTATSQLTLIAVASRLTAAAAPSWPCSRQPYRHSPTPCGLTTALTRMPTHPYPTPGH